MPSESTKPTPSEFSEYVVNPVWCIFAFVCVFLRLRRLRKMMVGDKKTEDGAKDEMEGRRKSDGGIRQIYTKEGEQ
ncbi:uncharacterized protein ASPGLDRAFT_1078378 [Aspergillus glaucus CBS 516.65]|uniref:Uncharacterized protein n=1 Tax=Aspergillus glaucus CBS 516.65 TaxID=1160497 RepID=A0A1L9V557_ASPGL|nr:hypothetical protein ASPGLDRAFT_1078378 [Aspergillus glaucus CBS 516.65]OJJ79047.1 hypothetical protein ASPGLDRAFT_1078378 [Aspergillus glaucus CBS 516.65]